MGRWRLLRWGHICQHGCLGRYPVDHHWFYSTLVFGGEFILRTTCQTTIWHDRPAEGARHTPHCIALIWWLKPKKKMSVISWKNIGVAMKWTTTMNTWSTGLECPTPMNGCTKIWLTNPTWSMTTRTPWWHMPHFFLVVPFSVGGHVLHNFIYSHTSCAYPKEGKRLKGFQKFFFYIYSCSHTTSLVCFNVVPLQA